MKNPTEVAFYALGVYLVNPSSCSRARTLLDFSIDEETKEVGREGPDGAFEGSRLPRVRCHHEF